MLSCNSGTRYQRATPHTLKGMVWCVHEHTWAELHRLMPTVNAILVRPTEVAFGCVERQPGDRSTRHLACELFLRYMKCCCRNRSKGSYGSPLKRSKHWDQPLSTAFFWPSLVKCQVITLRQGGFRTSHSQLCCQLYATCLSYRK